MVYQSELWKTGINSNTTLVKVKSVIAGGVAGSMPNSNTTLVKVKLKLK